MQIATISNMPNDTLMFGLSIGMGNASPSVQKTDTTSRIRAITRVFAKAMEKFGFIRKVEAKHR